MSDDQTQVDPSDDRLQVDSLDDQPQDDPSDDQSQEDSTDDQPQEDPSINERISPKSIRLTTRHQIMKGQKHWTNICSVVLGPPRICA